MIRSALLFSAALLSMLVCAACESFPGSTGGFAPPPPPPVRTFATCSDGSFLKHVQYFPNGYDASNKYGQLPPVGETIDQNSPYAAALQNAFDLAPPFFRDHLCKLNMIYVNGPAACADFPTCFSNSWGYRVPGSRGEYIAISAGLWSRPQPYVYHQFESDVLQAVYGWNPSWDPYVSPPTYASANQDADTFEMTILAALAHELGHVRWYHVLKPDHTAGHYEPNDLCRVGDTNFFSESWVTPVATPPIWQFLQTRSGRRGKSPTDLHLYDPQIYQIDALLRTQSISQASDDLDELYQPASPWASYFAAISPDEDFVETYKFLVLTNAGNPTTGAGPLISLPLNIYYVGGGFATEDIVADYFAKDANGFSLKPELARKAECIRRSLNQ